MKDARKTLKISKEGWYTLLKLSALSNYDMHYIVEQWLTSLEKNLEVLGSDTQRISLLSTQPDNNPEITVTYLGKIVSGQIRLPESLGDKVNEELSEIALDRDVQTNFVVKAPKREKKTLKIPVSELKILSEKKTVKIPIKGDILTKNGKVMRA